MQLAPIIKPKPSLSDIARQCLDAHEGDAKNAAKALADAILEDDSLFHEIMRAEVNRVARSQILKITRIKNVTEIKTGNSDFTDENSTDYQIPAGILAVATRNWLEYPLSNSVKLGAATVLHLQSAIENYKRQARQYQARARMLEVLAAKLPDDKTVGEIFTHEDIQKISIQTA
jgi:hypothetical protein